MRGTNNGGNGETVVRLGNRFRTESRRRPRVTRIKRNGYFILKNSYNVTIPFRILILNRISMDRILQKILTRIAHFILK